jgi:hypothetical protein
MPRIDEQAQLIELPGRMGRGDQSKPRKRRMWRVLSAEPRIFESMAKFDFTCRVT